MWSPRTHSLSFHGPEPTGLTLYWLLAKSSFSQMCLGRIPLHWFKRKLGSISFILKTTVVGFGVCTSLTALKYWRSREPTAGSRIFSTVNFTSSDVSGLPSCHFTFGRSVNVYVRWSGDSFHELARLGTTFPCGSKSTSPLKDMRGKCGQAPSRIGFITPGSVCTITSVPPDFG